MPNLGNAWHLPETADPRGTGGMRDPVGAVVAGAELIVRSGSQFAGPGNAADQLQVGSAVLARRVGDPDWTEFPMAFREALDNNKYYEAVLPAEFLRSGDTVSYLLRVPYSDRDTTFVHADGGVPGGSAVTGDLATAQATPFTVAVSAPADVGRWEPVIDLPNVAVHAILLPTGTVLMWGRRTEAGVGDLHVEDCRPFRWDPATGAVLPQSTDPEGPFNLFCSGHAFRPDGTLLVVGGHHLADGHGLATAFVYHPGDDRWERVADMNHGRWYPTATCLPDGGVLVTSGSFAAAGGAVVNNGEPQVWRDGAWHPVAGLPGQQAFDLYPRQHVAPGGAVVSTGPQATTWYLGTDGQWSAHGGRAAARRDYAPTAQYRDDRVLFLGGGNDQPDPTPTTACEILDLAPTPQDWRPAAPLAFPRRHHNATVLPDGTVLVTGGTRGAQFNDLSPGAPVHLAELWAPGPDDTGGTWRTLAGELRDRCYHATALLLPDGRVLSAGGGEFQAAPGVANDPRDTHADAQVFSPPYLFAGPRPTITAAPGEVDLGASFPVTVGDADVSRVTLVRLGAVTHALAMDQRFVELTFAAAGTSLAVSAPAAADRCPPGPYLLFVLSSLGVPSVARVVRVRATAPGPVLRLAAPQAAPRARPVGTAVTVGIEGVCPYGIGACWGGANEALHALTGVAAVDPVPDQAASTATVHLDGRGLPPLHLWPAEFHRVANGSYLLRGFEVELVGVLGRGAPGDGATVLRADAERPEVTLVPLQTLVQDRVAEEAERAAHARLSDVPPDVPLRVSGPLALVDGRYVLQVRAVTRT